MIRPNTMLSPEAAISVVEAAYDLDAGEEAWRRAITTALALAGIELASSIGPEVFGLLYVGA